MARADGYRVKLLWGNEEELARAREIAAIADNVDVLDQLSLTSIAELLVNSEGVVAVDTGLGHLAAALSVPVVSLYGGSNADLTGTYGRRQLHLQSSLSCAPCMNKNCSREDAPPQDQWQGKPFAVTPACFSSNPPPLVWQRLKGLLAGESGSLDKLFYPG